MKRIHRVGLAAAGAVLLVVAGSLIGDPEQFRSTGETEKPSEPPLRAASPPALEAPPMADQLSRAFENVAEAIRPSVVSVSSVRKIDGSDQQRGGPFASPFFNDPFFDRFFRRETPGGRVQQGQGTGFVVSDDGYIMTNHHVVAEADEVTVRAGRETYRAEVVGTDAKTDLAVLKIDAEGLAAARFGDSDALRVGQWVVAAGDPFGLASSITAGIVSATGRSRVGLADYEDFIQTDAAINPGNSGGPLVNLRGEVVGINTAIFTRSGGYMGIGFAIPANMAKSVMRSLIDEGRVVRGWLGVLIQDLDAGLAESFGYESTRGTLIGDVTEDGPAADAGLESGDIVTRFDGREVEDTTDLQLQVAATRPGAAVDVEVFRDGRRRTFEVEIGELEDGEPSALTSGGGSSERLGMTLRTLTPDIAVRLGYPDDMTGAVIAEVEPFSPAARAGLRPRDVIVQVQGQAVRSAEELRSELRRHDLERGVRLVVRSGPSQRFVFFKTMKGEAR